MKVLAKILIYFVAVILIGALLAPPLYWAGHALAGKGAFQFLGETALDKYFRRAVLVAALALLWPTARWLKIGSVRELGIAPDPRWRQHLLTGFSVAALAVAAMAGAYVALGFYHFKPTLPWAQLPKLAFGAIAVALLEEALFRGAIFGLLRKSFPPFTSLLSVSAIFSILHFLRPGPDLDPLAGAEVVRWFSGLALVPELFSAFGEPITLLAGFTTIFTLGWVVGYTTLRTGSLWMGIGFHAGLVFVKMGFSKFTKRDAELLPWVGRELQIGLVPVAVLALAGTYLWWQLRRENQRALPPN